MRLVHADWSTREGSRWTAQARREGAGWLVEAPRLVGPLDRFVHDLFAEPGPVLAGFDFPIGLPEAYGRATDLAGFGQAVQAFGAAPWARFYDVCDRPDEISLQRPFYPRVSVAGVRRDELSNGLGLGDFAALLRQCERATSDRRAACALFWTLGGNQVGKAAIHGWRSVVGPALVRGARLWPFDGDLGALSGQGRPVLCETYPAEAYRHLSVVFPRDGSKRRREDRLAATAGLAERCAAHGVGLDADMRQALEDGFGRHRTGEDAFDAAMGLLGMIEVVEGRRAAGPPCAYASAWEGWILGQAA